jgi:hypothetical protein
VGPSLDEFLTKHSDAWRATGSRRLSHRAVAPRRVPVVISVDIEAALTDAVFTANVAPSCAVNGLLCLAGDVRHLDDDSYTAV